MALEPFQFSKTFREERCDFCGRCFQECPVLALPLEQAQTEIRALIQGRPSEVLTRCTGCMACNSICPTAANPHTLILRRWEERYRKGGLPAVAGLVLPYQKPNLYTVLLEKLPPDEKALVDQWERNWRHPQGWDTMLYAGCNMILQPFLLDSALFRDVPVFGSLQICCGEPLYRMGCCDAVRSVAQRLKTDFARMGFKRLIVPCLAGYHLFSHVYPKVLDVSLDVEVVSVEEWLHERIANGAIRVAPLNRKAIVHDNCWPKASGDVFFEKIRALLALLGVEAVEPEHTRERALCCGMCAGAARFRLRDILKTARERLREFERADADMVVDYCGGCHWLFSLANRLSFSKASKPMYHVLELVQMAIGETPKHRADERAGQIIAAMGPKLLPKYLNRKRFWIEGTRD